MKKNELILLKKLLDDELNRRKRINEILDNEILIEYSMLTDTNFEKMDINEISVIRKILENFNITNTNKIYVCTRAYETRCNICYQETDYYDVDLDINSSKAEYKIYRDIESNKSVLGSKEPNDYGSEIISEFEKNNIVLNPYNTSKDKNGYSEVRLEFFNNSIKYGQIKSKNLILKKYPRL